MSEVKRKKGESFESLLRRFQGKMRQSGKALQAKKIRFYAPSDSKNKRRKSSLERLRRTQRRDYLIKIGKLKEEEPTKRKFHR